MFFLNVSSHASYFRISAKDKTQDGFQCLSSPWQLTLLLSMSFCIVRCAPVLVKRQFVWSSNMLCKPMKSNWTGCPWSFSHTIFCAQLCPFGMPGSAGSNSQNLTDLWSLDHHGFHRSSKHPSLHHFGLPSQHKHAMILMKYFSKRLVHRDNLFGLVDKVLMLVIYHTWHSVRYKLNNKEETLLVHGNLQMNDKHVWCVRGPIRDSIQNLIYQLWGMCSTSYINRWQTKHMFKHLVCGTLIWEVSQHFSERIIPFVRCLQQNKHSPDRESSHPERFPQSGDLDAHIWVSIIQKRRSSHE